MTTAAGDPISTPRPLSGLVVVVTRAAGDSEPLTTALTALGAEVRHLPMLTFEPPLDAEPLTRALADWDTFDWVAFTSPRGVTAVATSFRAGGIDPAARRPRRLAVVGPSTAAAARTVGWEPDLTPRRFDAEGLLEAFDGLGEPLARSRILLPIAEAARQTLAGGLRARGAQVVDVVAYRSAGPTVLDSDRAEGLLDGDRPILVTLTSPTTALNLLAHLGARVLTVPAAVIGPVTADAARAAGYQVVAVPDDHTLEGLTAAVVRWWMGR